VENWIAYGYVTVSNAVTSIERGDARIPSRPLLGHPDAGSVFVVSHPSRSALDRPAVRTGCGLVSPPHSSIVACDTARSVIGVGAHHDYLCATGAGLPKHNTVSGYVPTSLSPGHTLHQPGLEATQEDPVAAL
jgi:hypothetical protein